MMLTMDEAGTMRLVWCGRERDQKDMACRHGSESRVIAVFEMYVYRRYPVSMIERCINGAI